MIKYKVGEVEKCIVVKRPNSRQLGEAQIVASKIAAKLFSENAAITRLKLNDYMRANGLWSDEKETKIVELSNKIADLERKLNKGGNLNKARELALEIRKLRFEQTLLVMEKKQLDSYTVEGQVDNAKFDYLCSVCLLNEEGDPLFSSLEEYYENAERDEVVRAAEELANLYYNFDHKWQDSLPENKFLKKYKFVDSNGRLINKEGKLVDVDGRLINENGRLVDENGVLIDREGNIVDENGNLVGEPEFTDDEGNTV